MRAGGYYHYAIIPFSISRVADFGTDKSKTCCSVDHYLMNDEFNNNVVNLHIQKSMRAADEKL